MSEVENPYAGRRELLGAILAGGRSRRMGRPKEGLQLANGRPMIEHVIRVLRAVSPAVAIVGDCTGYPVSEHGDLIHLLDRTPDQGPLGGIEALLASGLAERYLVATCDQPLLSVPLLRRLIEVREDRPVFLVTESGEELVPFPCLLNAGWLRPVQEAMARGRLSVRERIRNSAVSWVCVPDSFQALTRSMNTPADLDRLGPGPARDGSDPA